MDDSKRILMVKVKNLKGDVVWTFPKGHIEKGEKAVETALREVAEETGWRCSIKSPLDTVTYWFQKGDELVKKTVRWFVMVPQEKVSEHDPIEIMETEWFDRDEAARKISYPSDKKLFKKLTEMAVVLLVLCLAGCKTVVKPVDDDMAGAPVKFNGEVFTVLDKGEVLVAKDEDGHSYCLRGDVAERLQLIIADKHEGNGLECELTGIIQKNRKCPLPGYTMFEVLEYRY